MFVLRNKTNHELFARDITVDVDFIHNIFGCETKAELEGYMYNVISQSENNYYVDDLEIIEIDDDLYHTINHHLDNDSDYKAYYYDNGVYELLNTRTGRLTRHEKYE